MAAPTLNLLAEPGFGEPGRALMAAAMAHRHKQREAAEYKHPQSHPAAHMVGRPGELNRPMPGLVRPGTFGGY